MTNQAQPLRPWSRSLSKTPHMFNYCTYVFFYKIYYYLIIIKYIKEYNSKTIVGNFVFPKPSRKFLLLINNRFLEEKGKIFFSMLS